MLEEVANGIDLVTAVVVDVQGDELLETQTDVGAELITARDVVVGEVVKVFELVTAVVVVGMVVVELLEKVEGQGEELVSFLPGMLQHVVCLLKYVWDF